LDEERLEDVVLAPDYLLLRERVFDAEDGGQRLNLYADGAPRLFEQVLVLVREQEYRLFGVVDRAVGEVGLVEEDERDGVRARNVARRDDGELVPGDAFAEDYLADSPARDVAAHGHAVEHAGRVEVVNVARRARHLRAPLLARNRLADVLIRH